MTTKIDHCLISQAEDGDVAVFMDVTGFSPDEATVVRLGERMCVTQGGRTLVDCELPDPWMVEAMRAAKRIVSFGIERAGHVDESYVLNENTVLER